jgi:hypothetical protein
MSKRISKRVREEAALVMAVCASNDCGTIDACNWLDLPHWGDRDDLETAAFIAALEAWRHWLGKYRKPREAYAEAEAMLRTGWSPE